MKKLKVIITRPRSQAVQFADELHKAGMEPFYFPVIEIKPITKNPALKQALQNLASFDWIVFTSSNGVEAVIYAMNQMDIATIPSNVKVAAIGPKTAEVLQAHRITPTFVPGEFIAEAILPGLGKLKGCKVLLPRAEIARKALPEGITAAGGTAFEIPVYRTLPTKIDKNGLNALRKGVDVITLTSSSIVENFVTIVSKEGLNPLHLPGYPLFACIGPITAQSAREQGFSNLIIANEFTSTGLILAIQAHILR